jgi:hypothetical protein
VTSLSRTYMRISHKAVYGTVSLARGKTFCRVRSFANYLRIGNGVLKQFPLQRTRVNTLTVRLLVCPYIIL